MNSSGYITFDQTLVLSRDSMKQKHIAEKVANRLQFLFVDEFQDTGNDVFQILDALRKFGVTKIYCVGDPEQYIQSFDSSIKNFVNIPILKASVASWFEVKMNDSNYRCSEKVIKFINNFNARSFDGKVFQQKRCEKINVITSESKPEIASEDVYFIPGNENVLPIITGFYALCDRVGISIGNRCLLAKEERVVKRIVAAVGNRYMNPKKDNSTSPVRIIQDTLLYVLGMNSGEFCTHYGKTQHELRKIAVDLFLKIRSEEIKDENEFGIYIHENWDLTVKETLPLKIENLKVDSSGAEIGELVTIANIHTIKGLEQKAVLVIAKTVDELLKWIEVDRTKRDEDKDDVCRIGYVAFSRAEQLLCIGCLESLSNECKIALGNLGVKFYISSEKAASDEKSI